ncbi:TetR family transcriptional regulator C-terminal domain-containing protein [Saccharopolyspora sp. K220]|uniref:TetR/AcrR family transcriptional regulator n=1 Tax=Saccharopolyspora soli TaxID=2926618 RepID=UPI001F583AAB|nr:TetR/AcrR family transcriptional regulator [Saccharopolyspora soli]MCI2418233.1 TetR family transcriptional regulator C-terminal domain-containing protein [Saccharopolyspora soli]
MPRPSVREEIVEAALVELHRRGFAATSVDTITKAAGVPKGSFYNHFKSKEALGVEVLARYVAGVGWQDEGDPELSPLGLLRKRFQLMTDVLVDNGYTRGCLIGNLGEELADHSSAIRSEVQTRLAEWSDSIAESLRAAQDAGEVSRDLDVARIARFILNAWQGALLRAKVVKNPEPLDDFFATVFDEILR